MNKLSWSALIVYLIVGCSEVPRPTNNNANSDSISNGNEVKVEKGYASNQDSNINHFDFAGEGSRIPDPHIGRVRAKPSARPPKEIKLSRESAVELARRALKNSGELSTSTLEAAELTKLADAGRFYNGGVLGRGDQREDDPMWVVRFSGRYQHFGTDNRERILSHMIYVIDANSGSFFSVGQP